MRSTTLSVCGPTRNLETSTNAVIAKATDENLTSENWEYILVRGTSVPKDDV